jgi:tRNA A37 threonylcarbamoyladenosine dehydratase
LALINPDCAVTPLCLRLTPENLFRVFEWLPDCLVDAIDTISVKVALAGRCHDRGIPLFMSMGTGGRTDPTLLRSGVLEDTRGTGCSLARVMRRLLKNTGSSPCKVVFSLEPPVRTVVASDVAGRHPPSSSAFVPPAAGLALAGLAVGCLTSKRPPAHA